MAAFDDECGHTAASTSSDQVDASNSPRNTTSGINATPYFAATSAWHRSMRLRTSRARAPGSVTMKLACLRDTRARPTARPFMPAPSTRAPAAHGTPAGSRKRWGSGLRNTHPALGTSSGCVRFRNRSEDRASARKIGYRGSSHAELCPQYHLVCLLHAAPVVAEAHVVARDPADAALRLQEADCRDQLADQSATKVSVPAHGAPDCPGSAGPRLQTSEPAVDRPADQPVEGHPGRRAHDVRRRLRDLAEAEADEETAHAGVADQHVRAAPEQGDRQVERAGRADRRRDLPLGAGIQVPIGFPPYAQGGQRCERLVATDTSRIECGAEQRLQLPVEIAPPPPAPRRNDIARIRRTHRFRCSHARPRTRPPPAPPARFDDRNVRTRSSRAEPIVRARVCPR